MLKNKRGLACVLFSVLLISSCAIFVRSNDINTDVKTESIESPVKVHLKDGRTVLFRSGATFTDIHIVGRGYIYSLDMTLAGTSDMINRKDVAAYEIFDSGINAPATLIGSAVATAGAAAVTALLAVAVFGSCPTVYAMTDSSMVMESELFSNSIAPIIEKRDVTDLYAVPDVSGLFELEIRNEALETHYINHLELLEVSHEAGSSVFPDTDGQAYALNDFQRPLAATDSFNRNLLSILTNSDDLEYTSNIDTTLSQDHVQWDTIDLEFKANNNIDKALVLDLRNSLFATVLLYDYLIASQGIKSLDWIGKELETVSGAVAMGDFSQSFLGMRVFQEIDGKYKPIDRISNTGPIASRKIAVPLEVTDENTIKVRLKFLSDSWRIDEVKLATIVEDPQIKYLPVDTFIDAKDQSSQVNLDKLTKPDDDYVVTMPGSRFTVSFVTEAPQDGNTHSYLLAAQGYYTEWVREEWIQNRPEIPFELNANLIQMAQYEWERVKDDFEQQFFNSKLPVR